MLFAKTSSDGYISPLDIDKHHHLCPQISATYQLADYNSGFNTLQKRSTHCFPFKDTLLDN